MCKEPYWSQDCQWGWFLFSMLSRATLHGQWVSFVTMEDWKGAAVIETMKLGCHRQRGGLTQRFTFSSHVCLKQVKAWNQAASLLVPTSIVTLIKRGHQRRLACWRQTQSVLIAIRRREKTFIHLIWNVQTLVETWDAFSVAARAREHMERRKLSDPPHLACVGAVFAFDTNP